MFVGSQPSGARNLLSLRGAEGEEDLLLRKGRMVGVESAVVGPGFLCGQWCPHASQQLPLEGRPVPGLPSTPSRDPVEEWLGARPWHPAQAPSSSTTCPSWVGPHFLLNPSWHGGRTGQPLGFCVASGVTSEKTYPVDTACISGEILGLFLGKLSVSWGGPERVIQSAIDPFICPL